MEKVSCIIPAYNEEKRIGAVLKVISNHPLVQEIIVVDDGSKDNTKEVAKKYKKVRLITYKNNKGKSFAITKGIEASKGQILIFIDSDLKGLDKKSVSDLILPVKNKKADMTISLRKNSLLIFKIIGLDFVSGERVMRKEVIGNYKKFLSLSCFGLESFMNKHIIEKKYKIKVVKWEKVSHARKSEKVGAVSGWIEDFSMFGQVVRTIGIFGIIKQIVKLKSLEIN